MGTAAVAALASGDRVVGTMPRSLLESEPPFSDVTERVVVECMHERKKQMSDRADGFLSLPSGLGTLDETHRNDHLSGSSASTTSRSGL